MSSHPKLLLNMRTEIPKELIWQIFYRVTSLITNCRVGPKLKNRMKSYLFDITAFVYYIFFLFVNTKY